MTETWAIMSCRNTLKAGLVLALTMGLGFNLMFWSGMLFAQIAQNEVEQAGCVVLFVIGLHTAASGIFSLFEDLRHSGGKYV